MAIDRDCVSIDWNFYHARAVANDGRQLTDWAKKEQQKNQFYFHCLFECNFYSNPLFSIRCNRFASGRLEIVGNSYWPLIPCLEKNTHKQKPCEHEWCDFQLNFHVCCVVVVYWRNFTGAFALQHTTRTHMTWQHAAVCAYYETESCVNIISPKLPCRCMNDFIILALTHLINYIMCVCEKHWLLVRLGTKRTGNIIALANGLPADQHFESIAFFSFCSHSNMIISMLWCDSYQLSMYFSVSVACLSG